MFLFFYFQSVSNLNPEKSLVCRIVLDALMCSFAIMLLTILLLSVFWLESLTYWILFKWLIKEDLYLPVYYSLSVCLPHALKLCIHIFFFKNRYFTIWIYFNYPMCFANYSWIIFFPEDFFETYHKILVCGNRFHIKTNFIFTMYEHSACTALFPVLFGHCSHSAVLIHVFPKHRFIVILSVSVF